MHCLVRLSLIKIAHLKNIDDTDSKAPDSLILLKYYKELIIKQKKNQMFLLLRMAGVCITCSEMKDERKR